MIHLEKYTKFSNKFAENTIIIVAHDVNFVLHIWNASTGRKINTIQNSDSIEEICDDVSYDITSQCDISNRGISNNINAIDTASGQMVVGYI